MNITVIKIGGNVVDDANARTEFYAQLSAIRSAVILVHGGGKVATELSSKLGIPTTMIDGRRVTDAETLRVVTMVYAGLINKQLVAELQSHGINALGITGADGNILRAHKRTHAQHDYGFVGDIDSVNTELLSQLVQANLLPVIAPLTHDGSGQLLNTNADTIAAQVASALAQTFTVDVIYCFEKRGVLRNVEDESTLIPSLTLTEYSALKANGVVAQGMIPKLDNAFDAIARGVHSVRITKYTHLDGGTLLHKGESA
ncbi:MAG: acetylglutamate kinase [Candidatus Kapabacteria bacterium]|nr:acetylglutamate kinase [Candidatus Kapabacteria bacterium]MBX7155113.1 acetylglutamate kinase [Bacteroidota bacterium]